MTKLILGTRGSDLALAQTRLVAAALAMHHPALFIETRVIRTTGDARLDIRLSEPGPLDKGLFTKELEEALLRDEVDAAVHSLKDLPTEQPADLLLGAILERADPADVLVSKLTGGLAALPAGAVVATSSLRRRHQLLHLRPDLAIVDIRGNVPTRIRKLADDPAMHGLVLAKAGLDRLGHGTIPDGLEATAIEEMLPAPGQGAIVVECRADDNTTLDLLRPLHHEDTARCVTAERDLLRSLGGGCHLPLGTRATIEDGALHLRAALFQTDHIEWLSHG